MLQKSGMYKNISRDTALDQQQHQMVLILLFQFIKFYLLHLDLMKKNHQMLQ